VPENMSVWKPWRR